MYLMIVLNQHKKEKIVIHLKNKVSKSTKNVSQILLTLTILNENIKDNFYNKTYMILI